MTHISTENKQMNSLSGFFQNIRYGAKETTLFGWAAQTWFSFPCLFAYFILVASRAGHRQNLANTVEAMCELK